jgi:hypothetical protein
MIVPNSEPISILAGLPAAAIILGRANTAEVMRSVKTALTMYSPALVLGDTLTDVAGFEAFHAAKSKRSCAKVVVQASKATAAISELIFIAVNLVKLIKLLGTVIY